MSPELWEFWGVTFHAKSYWRQRAVKDRVVACVNKRHGTDYRFCVVD